MRTPDEIKKDVKQAQLDYNAKSSFIIMLQGNTPESYLNELRHELKSLKQRLDQLKAELDEAK